MKKLLLTIATLALLLVGGSEVLAQNTLWGYYTSQGEALPSIEERTIIAAELGIFDYNGTAEQNSELLFRLQNPPPPALSAPDDLIGVSVVTNYRSALRSPMTATQATIPVASLLTTDGVTITTTTIDGAVYLTIAPGANDQEIVKCTGVDSENFTGCTRGLAFSGSDESSVSANRNAHSAGTVVVMSNVHYVFNRLIDGQTNNAQSIASPITFASSAAFSAAIPTIPTTTPTNENQVASKAYVDAQSFSTSTSNKVVVDAIAGDTIAENDIVYFDETDDEWKLASATFVDQPNYLLGLAMGAGTDGNGISGGVMTQGIKTGFAGLTPGEPYFLSDTAGDISLAAGTIFFELGYAQSATQLYFFPKFKSFVTKDQKDALQGTSGTPSSANKFVTNDDTATTSTADKLVRGDSSGKIDSAWIGTFFGNGNDGDVVISGNTTLTRDMYYNDLTVNEGVTLNTGGYRVFVKGTLTNVGTIEYNGNDGTAGGDGADGDDSTNTNNGSGGAALSFGSISAGVAGSNGGNGGAGGEQGGSGGDQTGKAGTVGTDGVSVSSSIGSGGVDNSVNNGGQGGTVSGRVPPVGSVGGDAGTATAPKSNVYNIQIAQSLFEIVEGPAIATLKTSASSGGGGGGSGGSGASATLCIGGQGGAGGGSGSSGGIVAIYAFSINNTVTGTIQAVGGDGGDGGDGGEDEIGEECGGGGGGGGGAGGTGGAIVLVYSSLTNSGSISVAGGSGGNGGTGGAGAIDNGTDGDAGINGATGQIYQLDLSNF
jgi:hypothetical protein